MKYIEYGIQNTEVIILLHGGGLSWWNFEDEAKLLEAKYHVILPILDGHAGSDRAFTSIEDNAKEVIEFIDKHFEGSVYLIGGLSLGAQVLVEVLSQRENICERAIIESALILPMKAVGSMISPSVKMSYELIKKEWFSKMQFKSLNMKEKYYENYFKDTCKITMNNMIAFLKANSDYKVKESLGKTKARVIVLVGKKEQNKMIDSARRLHQTLSNSKLIELEEYRHGDLSLNHPEEYVEKIIYEQ